jgi:hypothetical protein
MLGKKPMKEGGMDMKLIIIIGVVVIGLALGATFFMM